MKSSTGPLELTVSNMLAQCAEITVSASAGAIFFHVPIYEHGITRSIIGSVNGVFRSTALWAFEELRLVSLRQHCFWCGGSSETHLNRIIQKRPRAKTDTRTENRLYIYTNGDKKLRNEGVFVFKFYLFRWVMNSISHSQCRHYNIW